MWFTIFKYGLTRPFAKIFYHPRVEAEWHIPLEGGAIIAANHVSAGETIMLPSLIKRRLIFPAKKELFQGKGFVGRIVAWFLTAVGQVPMDRGGGRASAAALEPVSEVLVNGGLVGIFPEGTRSPDGRLYKGHTGVARLALQAQVPIIPVGLVNTKLVKGLFGIPVMRNAAMIFGEPLDFSAYYGQQNSGQVLRWVTNEVMAAIQALTENDYVDVYVNRVKYGDLLDSDLSSKILAHPNFGVQPPPTTAELGENSKPAPKLN